MVNIQNKIIKLKELIELRNEFRDNGKKLVFANGYFDPIHVGHIKHLLNAKKLGDVLIVGINSDESVKANKGPDRPFMLENERAEIIANLECVDYIIIFPELTSINTILTIKPDILVKGNNYKLNEVVGKDIVESYGGKIIMLPNVKGITSDKTLSSINIKK